MLRLVGREYLRLKGKRSRPYKSEFSRLRRELDLVCDWQRVTFDVPPSNASWRGLVRRAEAWHRQDTLAWREECLAGSLLCYSLTLDTTRERSTLAVRKYSDRIEIAQHYGPANCLPSTELSEGARQVLHMIQQHLKGCIE